MDVVIEELQNGGRCYFVTSFWNTWQRWSSTASRLSLSACRDVVSPSARKRQDFIRPGVAERNYYICKLSSNVFCEEKLENKHSCSHTTLPFP